MPTVRFVPTWTGQRGVLLRPREHGATFGTNEVDTRARSAEMALHGDDILVGDTEKGPKLFTEITLPSRMT